MQASDGKAHLAYELLITNAAALPVRIERIEAWDATTQKSVLIKSGGTCSGISRRCQAREVMRAPSIRLLISAPACCSLRNMGFVDGCFGADRGGFAGRLDHRLVGGLILPREAKPIPLELAVAAAEISTQPATVLSAPVRGGVWYMSEGCCCDDTHHRRGLVPINGALMVAQRFAVDFYKLDDQYQTWIRDPRKLESYLSYRQPIIAAAAGTVVRGEDGLPNNTALPKPPPIPPIDETVGNHVIVEIGPGTYVLYAHMDAGSVKVGIGQKIEKGQELGLIGTSGNSTTPHVHFQLLSTPIFFPTKSPLYVFDQFDLLGRIPIRLWDDNLGLEPTGKLPFKPDAAAGPHQNELPLDRAVVRFTGAE